MIQNLQELLNIWIRKIIVLMAAWALSQQHCYLPVDHNKKSTYLCILFLYLDYVKRSIKTCPFDGMGIVDIGMAKKWVEDLGLDYIPGSFQIRLCGVKGCLFVIPIDSLFVSPSSSMPICFKKEKISECMDLTIWFWRNPCLNTKNFIMRRKK